MTEILNLNCKNNAYKLVPIGGVKLLNSWPYSIHPNTVKHIEALLSVN